MIPVTPKQFQEVVEYVLIHNTNNLTIDERKRAIALTEKFEANVQAHMNENGNYFEVIVALLVHLETLMTLKVGPTPFMDAAMRTENNETN